MEHTTCPFCRETIKEGAIKCKHCSSNIVNLGIQHTIGDVNANVQAVNGTYWLPVPGFILSIFALLTTFAIIDDYEMGIVYSEDEVFGSLIIITTALVLSITSASIQQLGKGMAIAGITCSTISALIFTTYFWS